MRHSKIGIAVILTFLVFMIFWGYNHLFWTKLDPTLSLTDEQACFDAFGLYTFAKLVHHEHIHPQEVAETLWGPLPYYLYAIGLDIFGEKLSSIREVIAFFSGIWGAIIFLILYFSSKNIFLSFFITLFFIPFSGHLNFHANRGYAHFYTFILQTISLFIILLYSQKRKILFLIFIGLMQGISFGFKYELSLLGLLATLMSLCLFETIEAYNYVKEERNPDSYDMKSFVLRIIKLLPLILILLYSAHLIYTGFLPLILFIFWTACFGILFLELNLCWTLWQKKTNPHTGMRSLIINTLAVLTPFSLVILFLFLHLWQATSLQVAKDYFMQLADTSTQIYRMGLSSPAFSGSNLTYFMNTHPISISQIITWCLYAFAISLMLFFVRDIIISGIISGFTLFILFKILGINQINIFSIYYFITAISLFLWLYLLSRIYKSEIKDLSLGFVVCLCFLAAGSLSLLRESGSLDLNVWSMLPPLIGSIIFLTYSTTVFSKKINWIKTFCFIAIFYFAAASWLRIERLNLLYLRAIPAGNNFKMVDSEFDLFMPAETAVELQKMKKYFQENLGNNEYIFIFSDHVYPYIFTPNGSPTKYLISFQTPNKIKEQRMLELFRTKKIKYVLFSNGIIAYNSIKAAESFPDIYAFISMNYLKTENHFMNFIVYQRKNP